PPVSVTETVSYTNGTQDVSLHYAIANPGADLIYRAGELADLYVDGSDEGTGVLQAGPPRFVGGASAAGTTTGLVEQTTWDAWQESFYSTVFDNFGATGLDRTVDASLQDNGVGAQWNFTLNRGAPPKTIDVTWRFGTPHVVPTPTPQPIVSPTPTPSP